MSFGAVRFGLSGPAPPCLPGGVSRFGLCSPVRFVGAGSAWLVPWGPGSTCAERFDLRGVVRPAQGLARLNPELFRPNPAQPGRLIQSAQPDSARPSTTQPDSARPNPAQSGPILPNPARPGPIRPSPAQPGPIRPNPAQPGPIQSSLIRPSLIQPDPIRPSLIQPGYVPGCKARPGCGGRPGQRSRPLPDGRVGWGCNEKADLPKGKSALFRFPKALTRSAE